MSTLRIPVRHDIPARAYSMTVELDGEYYDLALRFNSRDDHWYVDVSHLGVTTVTGVKLVEGDDWLKQVAHMEADSRLPPGGTFQVLDTAGSDKDPDDKDLGDRVVLLYKEAP